jgi:hypothetical protein
MLLDKLQQIYHTPIGKDEEKVKEGMLIGKIGNDDGNEDRNEENENGWDGGM